MGGRAAFDGDIAAFDCQSCGACCSYDATWPRFTLESDAALDALPTELVSADLRGMACAGNRCLALTGVIGEATACSIHPMRPDVCRACMPGDPECLTARAFHGLPDISPETGLSTPG